MLKNIDFVTVLIIIVKLRLEKTSLVRNTVFFFSHNGKRSFFQMIIEKKELGRFLKKPNEFLSLPVTYKLDGLKYRIHSELK